ncbi:MAG: hypothetical protein OEW68_18085, partial [Gammaproteobacteria bacterium]|nr:hypothetical protein [Gammaproteobacteria bacterium]
MSVSKYKIAWAAVVATIAIPLNACSQEEPSPVAKDTAVHTAEVAQGGMADVLARGEKVYLGNCAACHQPTGV